MSSAQAVNVGAAGNDGTGDPLRTAFLKLQLGNVQGQPYNASGGGSVDDRTAIAAADTAVVANLGGWVVFPVGTYRVASNLTITSGVYFLPGAILAPDTGVTVTLSGPLSAPFQKCFGGLGSVVFSAGPKLERVLPQWWGALGDGTTNDAPAIQSAINALAGTGGRVYFNHPSSMYYISSTTINISVEGIILEASDSQTYVKYAGTGYAISFSLAGSAQQNNCGMLNLGVVCTNASGGSAVYMKSPYSCFIEHGYFENAISSNTGVGITLDGGISVGGITHTGTGYYGTNTLIRHVRCYGFLKGILFQGGALGGWDILIGCKIEECFISSQVGLTGSVGVEWQGAQQCVLLGGNIEQVDYGVKMISTPSACIGNTLDHPRFESTAVNNWLIPADGTNNTVINPKWFADNGSDLAVDTLRLDTTLAVMPPQTLQLKGVAIACVNGDNNHTLSRGNSTYIRITGPTGAFAIGGFSITPKAAALMNGTEVTVWNTTAFAMTINNGDASATASCNIRTLSGGNIVQSASFGGGSARFVYDSSFAQWVCHQFSG